MDNEKKEYSAREVAVNLFDELKKCAMNKTKDGQCENCAPKAPINNQAAPIKVNKIEKLQGFLNKIEQKRASRKPVNLPGLGKAESPLSELEDQKAKESTKLAGLDKTSKEYQDLLERIKALNEKIRKQHELNEAR